MKIAFFSTKPYDKSFFVKGNERYGFEMEFYETNLDVQVVNAIEDTTDVVCVFVNDTVNREVIATLAKKGVKIIALRCAGFNNVDIDAIREFKLRLCRVPAYSPEAVAEHATALLLTINRKTHKAYNRVREQNFALHGLLGFNLHGKTVGVIGTGKIGKAFCSIMQGFGCNVLANDPYPDAEFSVNYVPIETIWAKSDVISLHLPLNDASSYMINKESLAKMKKGVTLINTSRGGLIHTLDVIDALKTGHIGHLALDVYEQESEFFFRDLSETIITDDVLQRLLSFSNVIVTGHQAFFTQEAMSQITEITLQSVHDLLSGKEPEDVSVILV